MYLYNIVSSKSCILLNIYATGVKLSLVVAHGCPFIIPPLWLGWNDICTLYKLYTQCGYIYPFFIGKFKLFYEFLPAKSCILLNIYATGFKLSLVVAHGGPFIIPPLWLGWNASGEVTKWSGL